MWRSFGYKTLKEKLKQSLGPPALLLSSHLATGNTAAAAAGGGSQVELGRYGSQLLKIGIVGMPNVGKSSLFNLLSGLQVPAENYPFCTIEPNTALVTVPDKRLDHLSKIWKPKKITPALLSITDIAGLVKGAAEGKGLGNAFLSNIQAVDAIYHLVRVFSDDRIQHVEGSVDYLRDIEIIRNELIAKDREKAQKEVEILAKKMKTVAREKFEQDFLSAQKLAALLLSPSSSSSSEVRHGKKSFNTNDIDFVNRTQFLTAKPVVFLLNLSALDFSTLSKRQAIVADVRKWLLNRYNENPNNNNDDDDQTPIVPFSLTHEQILKELGGELEEEENQRSMLGDIIVTGYKTLKLINYYTTGEDEVRAWTVKRGSKAPQAAGMIHSDFEERFICCEVYNYADLVRLGSEQAVRNAGKIKTQGRDYVVQDGDIIFFKTAAKKK